MRTRSAASIVLLAAMTAGPGVAAVGVATSLSGCGRRPSLPRARGPDRSTPEAVLAGAAQALRAGDLAALSAWLSPLGETQVRRDLDAWRAVLVDPATGPRAIGRLALPTDAAVQADLRAALEGDAAAMLRIYARTRAPSPPVGPAPPVPGAPPPTPVRAADARWAELDLLGLDGTRRRVVLTRPDAEWRIDQLTL